MKIIDEEGTICKCNKMFQLCAGMQAFYCDYYIISCKSKIVFFYQGKLTSFLDLFSDHFVLRQFKKSNEKLS